VRLDKSEVRLCPGLTLLLDATIGGYDKDLGFVGGAGKDSKRPVEPAPLEALGLAEQDTESGATVEDDGQSFEYKAAVSLADHMRRVVEQLEGKLRKPGIAERLRGEQGIAQLDEREAAMLIRAACWHDLGKAYAPFQERLGRTPDGPLVAKSERKGPKREREPRSRRTARRGRGRRLARTACAAISAMSWRRRWRSWRSTTARRMPTLSPI
jgi:hypothetical protein